MLCLELSYLIVFMIPDLVNMLVFYFIFFFSSRRRHTRCALVTGVQTCALPISLNAQAKSAARSAFESAKQRFFNHLITAMQTPSLVASIARDLEAGHACVVQIVSTGEALMERRLADIPTEEWDDVRVDVTPREYVLSYLEHSFPVRSEEHTSELQSLMRISYAVFCLKKKNKTQTKYRA